MTRKTRLNRTHRFVIASYAAQSITAGIDRSREQELRKQLIEATNAAIRQRYPEADMAVLRKYRLTRTERQLRFQFPGGRVEAFHFDAEARIVDLPHRYAGEAFPMKAEFEQLYDAHVTEAQTNATLELERSAQFKDFLDACTTVEDVLEVIDLPACVRERLGHESPARVATTPETIASLKETFGTRA